MKKYFKVKQKMALNSIFPINVNISIVTHLADLSSLPQRFQISPQKLLMRFQHFKDSLQ